MCIHINLHISAYIYIQMGRWKYIPSIVAGGSTLPLNVEALLPRSTLLLIVVTWSFINEMRGETTTTVFPRCRAGI